MPERRRLPWKHPDLEFVLRTLEIPPDGLKLWLGRCAVCNDPFFAYRRSDYCSHLCRHRQEYRRKLERRVRPLR